MLEQLPEGKLAAWLREALAQAFANRYDVSSGS